LLGTDFSNNPSNQTNLNNITFDSLLKGEQQKQQKQMNYLGFTL
jgi:hypothetical protein